MKTVTKAFAEKYVWQGQRADDLANARQARESISLAVEQAPWRQEVVPSLKDDRRAAVAVSIAVLQEELRLAERFDNERWQEPEL